MVVFGASEGGERLQLLDAFLSSGLKLTFVVIEDGASVLPTDTHADKVSLSLSDVKQLFVRNDIWIEVDLNGLGVVPDATVGGAGRFAAAVADSRTNDSVETPKLGVRSPESAERKGGGLVSCLHTFVDVGRGRFATGCKLVGAGPAERC